MQAARPAGETRKPSHGAWYALHASEIASRNITPFVFIYDARLCLLDYGLLMAFVTDASTVL